MSIRRIEQLNMISNFYSKLQISLVQKYKNRIKELDNSQKKEIASFQRNLNLSNNMINNNNLTRNSSKMSNLMREDEGEN